MCVCVYVYILCISVFHYFFSISMFKYLGYTPTKILFIICFKFKFNSH